MPAADRERARRIDVICPAFFLPDPTSTKVPTIERTIWWQKDDASISKRRRPSPPSIHRASVTTLTVEAFGSVGRRQNDAKSCSPMSASAASLIDDTSRWPDTCHDVDDENGSA